ncbi:nucleotide sugar dehydrogenase, partial [Cryobacterium sp. MLB-32]
MLVPILENGSGLQAGRDFYVGYSPERIDPGNSLWGFVETPKVVSGIDADSLAHVKAFYDELVNQTVPVSSPKEAELTKLLENTFRHVNIALVNELAIFAHQLGVNVWESIEAAGTKPFGFMKFTPGPGVGGHCLPVDPSYLSWQVKRKLGQNFRFVELANDVNDHMPQYVVQRMLELLNERGKP